MKKVLCVYMLFLCPMLVLAQENPIEEMFIVPMEAVDIDIFDSSFARHVSFDAIGEAWANQDPVLLTDCALELAEAERILFRNLKTMTSEALLKKAITLATDQKDVETLDRIARYATAANKEALANSATIAKQLSGEERAILPVLPIDLFSTPIEKISLMKGMIYDIDKARVNGNKSYLADIAKTITESPELNSLLKKSEAEGIKKYAEDSEKMTAESSDDEKEMENVLDKLAGEERALLSKERMVKLASDKQIHDGLLDYMRSDAIYAPVREYVTKTYKAKGVDWKKIRAVAEGAYVHKGDKMQYIRANVNRLPQEGIKIFQEIFGK